jgi:hypothetical protein
MQFQITREHRLSSIVTLEQAVKGQKGSKGIALLFLSALDRGKQSTPRSDRFTTIVHEVGWAKGSILTGVRNFASTGIRSPDRPVRSGSLHRLGSRGPLHVEIENLKGFITSVRFTITVVVVAVAVIVVVVVVVDLHCVKHVMLRATK